MADIRVRELPKEVVEQWKVRARLSGQSLQETLRELLITEALRPRREIVSELRILHEQIRQSTGELPDSALAIREERERLG